MRYIGREQQLDKHTINDIVSAISIIYNCISLNKYRFDLKMKEVYEF